MERNLPFWLKVIIGGTLFLFIAIGWIMFLQGKNTRETAMLKVDKSNYIRLHILANSDSLEDQELKLKVKDAVVEYLTPFLKDALSPSEAGEVIRRRQEDILQVAHREITRNAAHYPVFMEIGEFDFPLKSYGALILPEGNYQAVRLLIGEGGGENWWCVLFPPLCFIDGSGGYAGEFAQKDSDEKKDEGKIEIHWKILELIDAKFSPTSDNFL